MASIITHVAIPLSLWAGLKSRNQSHPVSMRLLIIACLVSMLPDLDVIAFKLGIAYSSEYGHRGFTHSIFFSLTIGFIGLLFSRYLKSSKIIIFLLLTLSTLSHAILDAMTNGGLGVAFFWPLSDARYFLPWQPIQVSPIGVENFMTSRGIHVLQSEFYWVWLPSLLFSLTLLTARYGISQVRLLLADKS